MKKYPLPPLYGIAELGDGRFYPVYAYDDECDPPRLKVTSHMRWEWVKERDIPPAIGPWHQQGVVSFATRRAALAFCQRYDERYRLQLSWKKVTIKSDLYPERTAWYYDMLEEMTGNRPHPAYFDARWYLWLADGTLCKADGDTMGEALVNLYTIVCERLALDSCAVESLP